MSDRKPQNASPAPADEDIAEEAARLTEKWALAARKAPANGTPAASDGTEAAQPRRTTSSGPILQTLEKGRTHMVTVEVKKRRKTGPNGKDK